MKEDLEKSCKDERKRLQNLLLWQELEMGGKCHPRSGGHSAEYIPDIRTNRSILKTDVKAQCFW